MTAVYEMASGGGKDRQQPAAVREAANLILQAFQNAFSVAVASPGDFTESREEQLPPHPPLLNQPQGQNSLSCREPHVSVDNNR